MAEFLARLLAPLTGLIGGAHMPLVFLAVLDVLVMLALVALMYLLARRWL